tara:strand:- start:20388 stop:20660 length:273 start_codon:yes stop_codon:yes gene_type:complete
LKIFTGEELLNSKTDKSGEILEESTYRRGYYHGYDSAIDDMRAYSHKKVIGFFNKTLLKWRYGKIPFKKTFDFPPSMKPKLKEVDTNGDV